MEVGRDPALGNGGLDGQGDGVGEAPDVGEAGLDLGEPGVDVLVEGQAGRCESRAGAVADEQRGLQLVFEEGDLARDGGLRDPQRACRAGERAGSHDGVEHDQPVDAAHEAVQGTIHHHTVPDPTIHNKN